MALDVFDTGGATVNGAPLVFDFQPEDFGFFIQPVEAFTPNVSFQPGPGQLDFSGGEPIMPLGTGGEPFTLANTIPMVKDASGMFVDAFGAGVEPGVTAAEVQAVQQVLADVAGQADPQGILDGLGVDPRTGQVYRLADGSPLTPQNAKSEEVGFFGRLGATLKPVEAFLGTNIGRTLGVLGLGGVGALLGYALAPSPPKLQMPTLATTPQVPAIRASQESLNRALTQPGAPTPSSFPFTLAPNVDLTGLGPSRAGGAADLETLFRLSLAGQRNVADTALGASARELVAQGEQAGLERDIRLNALMQTPGLLAPTANLAPSLATGLGLSNLIGTTLANAPASGQTITPGMFADPIRQAMAAQVTSVLAGNLPTPELDRQFRAEELQLRNGLLQAHGPGFETSSPGIEALQKLRESQQVRREQYKFQVLASLAPQEAQRRQFDITTPESQYLSRLGAYLPGELQRAQFAEQTQGTRLAQNVGLSQGLGRTPPPQSLTTLSSLVPIQPLLGLGTAENATALQNRLQTEAALSAFNLGSQQAAQTPGAIANLFTTAAGIGLAPTPNLIRVGAG